MYIMNIFKLDDNPEIAAQMHCDKHVVKMIVEAAQMLSTAHRMLDGFHTKRLSKSGKRMIRYYEHPNSELENVLYKAVHHNHPSAIWTRETFCNYTWHYHLWLNLCKEYTYRYGKTHSTWNLLHSVLSHHPKNISMRTQSELPRAMGTQPQLRDNKQISTVKAYRHFYTTKKDRFQMTWTKRGEPHWWKQYQINSI